MPACTDVAPMAPRLRRSVAAAIVLLMAVALVPAFQGAAEAASSTFFSVSSRRPISVLGKPYKMAFTAFKSSSGASLNITFTRKASTGNRPVQVHSYSFDLSGSSVRIDGSDLLPTSIDTGTQMGKFGKVAMHVRSPTALRTQQIKCSNGMVTGSLRSRTGVLSGNLTLFANDGYFHRIHKTDIGVTVTKLFSNGKSCPGGGGGGCPTGLSFFAGQSSKPLTLLATRPLGGAGRAHISLSYSRTDGPARISHTISATVSLAAFTVGGAGGVTIAGGSLAPFATGTVHFAKQGTGTRGGTATCRKVTFKEKHSGGSVTAKFDSGAQKTMDGADFATLTRTFKP
jgi:hypothetical protein